MFKIAPVVLSRVSNADVRAAAKACPLSITKLLITTPIELGWSAGKGDRPAAFPGQLCSKLDKTTAFCPGIGARRASESARVYSGTPTCTFKPWP
eukprot:2825245-Pyramimonas_sp.AAC.1